MTDIEFSIKNRLGLVTLNRPQKLNALTHPMCQAFDQTLKAWAENDEIKAVVVRGRGEKAFCAGGDVASVYHNGINNTEPSKAFFETEYTLNARIHHYPKPYIALMHGICMGGGLGVSVHGKFRVADPKTTIAMPETGIGFFPDVGGSYFLSRAPGELGTYLGLTGARIGVDDAYYCGLIDCQLAFDQFEELMLFIADFKVDITSVIQSVGRRFSPAPLSDQREMIDRCFAFDSVEEIFSALEDESHEFALTTLNTLNTKSPTSLTMTLKQLRAAKHKTFDQCMLMERRLVDYCLSQPDFYEGVRAAVIDKDQSPKWQKEVKVPFEVF